MSTGFRLAYGGIIKKSETRKAGEHTVVKLQLCRANRGGAPDAEKTFTWITINVWDPKEWQLPFLGAGKFISGWGEFSMRSYLDKDNAKRFSAEARSTSFDIDIADDPAERSAPATAPVRPAAPAATSSADEPPF